MGLPRHQYTTRGNECGEEAHFGPAGGQRSEHACNAAGRVLPNHEPQMIQEIGVVSLRARSEHLGQEFIRNDFHARQFDLGRQFVTPASCLRSFRR
jgi:hypothetical protein